MEGVGGETAETLVISVSWRVAEELGGYDGRIVLPFRYALVGI